MVPCDASSRVDERPPIAVRMGLRFATTSSALVADQSETIRAASTNALLIYRQLATSWIDAHRHRPSTAVHDLQREIWPTTSWRGSNVRLRKTKAQA